VIDKAITARQTAGYDPKDHLAGIRKMVDIEQNDLRTEPRITGEHVKNNEEVRRLLVDRGIVPERLPAAEDVKKVERRLQAEQKELPKQIEGLEVPTADD